MPESIEEMKERIYPERKVSAMRIAELQIGPLLQMANQADEAEQEVVEVPLHVVNDICSALAFLSRFDSYGEISADPNRRDKGLPESTCKQLDKLADAAEYWKKSREQGRIPETIGRSMIDIARWMLAEI